METATKRLYSGSTHPPSVLLSPSNPIKFIEEIQEENTHLLPRVSSELRTNQDEETKVNVVITQAGTWAVVCDHGLKPPQYSPSSTASSCAEFQ